MGIVQRLILHPSSFSWIWMFFSFGCFYLFLVVCFFGGVRVGSVLVVASLLLSSKHSVTELYPTPYINQFLNIYHIYDLSVSACIHTYTMAFSLMWIDFFESVSAHFCKSGKVNIFTDFFLTHSSCLAVSRYLTMSSVEVSHSRPNAGSHLPLNYHSSLACRHPHNSSVLHGINPVKEHSPDLLQNDAPLWHSTE